MNCSKHMRVEDVRVEFNFNRPMQMNIRDRRVDVTEIDRFVRESEHVAFEIRVAHTTEDEIEDLRIVKRPRTQRHTVVRIEDSQLLNIERLKQRSDLRLVKIAARSNQLAVRIIKLKIAIC